MTNKEKIDLVNTLTEFLRSTTQKKWNPDTEEVEYFNTILSTSEIADVKRKLLYILQEIN